MDAGIDYGHGQTNIDKETGIRYGCISMHLVTQAWADSAEPDYGTPECPSCGEETLTDDTDDKDYRCTACGRAYWSDDVYPEQPLGWSLDDGEYIAVDCLDTDILIIKSPYYTYAPYCSPCVPGAGCLTDDDSPRDASDGIRAYCFGHDWYDEGKAPYRVYRVSDDSEVLSEGDV